MRAGVQNGDGPGGASCRIGIAAMPWCRQWHVGRNEFLRSAVTRLRFRGPSHRQNPLP